jgi:hypothetical protein
MLKGYCLALKDDKVDSSLGTPMKSENNSDNE